jgi:DNA-binding NarL/FixJ family response regulator
MQDWPDESDRKPASGPRRIAILLVCKDPGEVEALRTLLCPHFEIAGDLPDGEELIDTAKRLNPDVVVLDLPTPSLDKIEAARELKREVPGAKLIFVAVSVTSIFLGSAFCAGAQGCVLKTKAHAELVCAVREALEGRTYVSPGIIDVPISALRLAKPLASLTAREREVLRLTARGKTAKEIASAMKISPRTVAFHKSNIMEKLGARTTAELATIAAQWGMEE